MKFIVSTTNLLKALQSISGVIKSGGVLPILEDFLFEIRNGDLTVFATDLDVSMETKLKVESKESCKIALPAKLLIDTLKMMPEQPLTFMIDTKSLAVEIISETGHFKLTGENADDFPKTPEADGVTTINIPTSALSKVIAKTLFAISSDDLRPAMTGVLFDIAKNGMTFVSTDAHNLVKVVRSDIKAEKQIEFIVPKKAISLLKSALPAVDDSANVSFNKSNAFFSFGNIKLITRLVDAKYPDYNAVIPQNSPSTLQVNRLELLHAMKRVFLYSNATTYQTVLSVSGTELRITTEDLDFSKQAAEMLTCTYDGEDIQIAFNARFVIDVLTVLDSSDVDIDLSAPTKPGIFRPTDNEENEVLLMLVMPVAING